jgi:hypothetical protein
MKSKRLTDSSRRPLTIETNHEQLTPLSRAANNRQLFNYT